MSDAQESVTIQADKDRVFDAFVNKIDRWWPRRGTYRYSFASAPQQPHQIHFEPRLHGRFYEIFDDGSTYEIGRITAWEPPDRLVYTWRDPRWPGHTTVEVTFQERNGSTMVTVHHSGFGEGDVPDHSVGYQVGLAEILLAFHQSTTMVDPTQV